MAIRFAHRTEAGEELARRLTAYAHRPDAFAILAISGKRLLEFVLLAFAQAGLVKQIAKDEFAPVALRLGRAP